MAELSIAEWVVLAVVEEGPTHGFAISALTARRGDLGRIWHVPKPVVYRALGRLEQAGLVGLDEVEQGGGPQRRLYRAMPAGRTEVARWLVEPVGHVREMRSAFLLKLALLDRRGADRRPLARAQREAFAPIVAALDGRADGGFEEILAAWRRANLRAAVHFLDEIDDPDAD